MYRRYIKHKNSQLKQYCIYKDCDTQSLPSKQLNSIDIRPTSTVHVTPSSLESYNRSFFDKVSIGNKSIHLDPLNHFNK